MLFKFTCIKAQGATDHEFEMAISCAKTSIESVLYEEAESIENIGDTIYINIIGETINSLKDKLRGCFCDSMRRTYPEFASIHASAA
jgi:hypothetical protein